MLSTAAAWMYVTLLCWGWGRFTVRFFSFVTGGKDQAYGLPVLCVTGLATIAPLAGILSLFFPLGTAWVHLFFFAPVLWLLFVNENLKRFAQSIAGVFFPVPWSLRLLFFANIFLLLIMSVWDVKHPDTLGYHAQTIRWIEEYKVVPGLVHLHARFGLQGLWFVVCALFRFSFLGVDGITFLNGAVLVWFFLFLFERIRSAYHGRETVPLVLWLLLGAQSWWHYTDIRLTATSPSPDFVAAIFLWLVFYTYLNKERTVTYALVLILLAAAAIVFKLAVAPVALLMALLFVQLLRQKKYGAFVTALIICVMVFSPFFIRHIYTSGYAIFPLPATAITNTDWTYDERPTRVVQRYITAYGRNPNTRTEADANAIMEQELLEWLPPWWKSKSIADKFLLCSLVILLVAGTPAAVSRFRTDYRYFFVIGICLLGLLFWAANAPDLRFAVGFIVPLQAVFLFAITQRLRLPVWSRMRSAVFVYGASALLLAYTGYRLAHFFELKNLLLPAGVGSVIFKTQRCNDIPINVPVGDECANLPLPCAYGGCTHFVPRGKKITDGFKAR